MAQQFTVFSQNDTVFALSVENVREVLRAAALSAAPTNPVLEGWLNLRGDSVPVLDVRSLLALPTQPISPSDFLIVIEDDHRVAALRSTTPVQLESADLVSNQNASNSSLVEGTARQGERIVSVLNASALVAAIGSAGSQALKRGKSH